MQKTVVIFLALVIFSSQQLFNQTTFCWRDSITRGIGTIPDTCPSGKQKIGLLCYTRCPSGYSRFGFDCHQTCPGNFRDDGLFCRLAEYTREGFPWQFGDWLNSDGMFARCQAKYGAGKCQQSGAIVYPKCAAGYSSFGCCICRPNEFSCSDYGLGGKFDLSCAKNIIIGDPTPMQCRNGLEYDAGLCYSPCGKKDYDPVGPVCWGKAPPGWVLCGMGAAKSTLSCTTTVFSQVTSVANLAINIATLGAGTGVSKGTSMASKAPKELLQLYDKLKKAYETNKALIQKGKTVLDVAGKAATIASIGMNLADQDVVIEDIVRISAQIASLMDPTGIADVVAAYTYPKCKSTTS